MICKHYYISGRVQGVFFRKYTQAEALSHSLTGWVRNLPDGRVEVMAAGNEEAVRQLEAWLHHGPPLAAVQSVQQVACKEQAFDGFKIL